MPASVPGLVGIEAVGQNDIGEPRRLGDSFVAGSLTAPLTANLLRQ